MNTKTNGAGGSLATQSKVGPGDRPGGVCIEVIGDTADLGGSGIEPDEADRHIGSVPCPVSLLPERERVEVSKPNTVNILVDISYAWIDPRIEYD